MAAGALGKVLRLWLLNLILVPGLVRVLATRSSSRASVSATFLFGSVVTTGIIIIVRVPDLTLFTSK